MHAGTFMALQEKVIACGPSMTIIGLVLKFIAGPAATAIGAIAVGLRGDVLRVVIIQVINFIHRSNTYCVCFHYKIHALFLYWFTLWKSFFLTSLLVINC